MTDQVQFFISHNRNIKSIQIQTYNQHSRMYLGSPYYERMNSINELSPIHDSKLLANHADRVNELEDELRQIDQRREVRIRSRENSYEKSRNNSSQKYHKEQTSSMRHNQSHHREPDHLKAGINGSLMRTQQKEKNSFLLRSYQRPSTNAPQPLLHRYHQQQAQQNPPAQYSSPHFVISSSKPLQSATEYELLLQYQLKREQQKAAILQQRLQNKQSFILEMKAIQEELTMSYARCQQELNLANQKIFQMQSYGAKQVRQYKQQIQQLKHQLLKAHENLQQQKNKKTKKVLATNIKGSSIPRPTKSKSSINLVKNSTHSSIVNLINKNTPKNPSPSSSLTKPVLPRSNTHSILQPLSYAQSYLTSQFESVNHQIQENEERVSELELEIIQNVKKVANFMEHFIQMFHKLNNPLNLNQNFKLLPQLKQAWKWVKQTIKEWKQLKDHRHTIKSHNNGQEHDHDIKQVQNVNRQAEKEQISEKP